MDWQGAHGVLSERSSLPEGGLGDSLLDVQRLGAAFEHTLRVYRPESMEYDSVRADRDTVYASSMMRYVVAQQLHCGGYFDESNRLSASAASTFYRNRDFREAFYSLLLQVSSLMHMGAYNEAFPTVLRAHTLAWNQHDALLIAMAQDWIGRLYMAQGNTSAAILYYEDAVTRTRSLDGGGMVRALSQRLGHLAEAYVGAGRYDDALRSAEEALSCFTGAQCFSVGVHAQLAKGMAYEALGNAVAAEVAYGAALAGSREAGQLYEEALGLRHLGTLRMGQFRYVEADSLFALAYDLATRHDMHPMRASLLHRRAQVVRERYPLRALAYLEEYISLSDSLARLSARQQMNALHARHESELKQHRIEVQDLQLGRAAILRRVLLISIALALVAVVLLVFFLHYHRMRNRHLALLNQTKDTFFSIISHDTKNLSVAIRNTLTQMDAHLDSLSKEQIARYIGMLHGASEEETNLLDNLLHWANVQLKAEPFSPVRFDVVGVVRRVGSLFSFPLAIKSLRLEESYPSVAEAWGDVRMVELIVRNLLSNAVKFSEPGGAVYLSIAIEEHGVCVSVRDEGIGMSAEQVGKLGCLDQRCIRRGTQGESGTGLGLILSYSMARRNGARILVDSAEGQGTAMRLHLLSGPRAGRRNRLRKWIGGGA